MRRVTVPLLAAAAVTISSCGAAEPYAAKVNDREIPTENVTVELKAIRDNRDFAEAIAQQSGVAVRGSSANSFNSSFVALVLTRQVVFELIGAEFDRRDLETTADDEEAARRDLYVQLGSDDPEAGREVFESFPERYREMLVDWNAEALVLQGALVGQRGVSLEAAEEFFEDDPERFEQACARQIQVDTEEEADSIFALLQGGADFAELAEARSNGAGADDGGQLPCFMRGEFPPAFEEAMFGAEIGEPTRPVRTEFGFNIFLVESREVPAFADVQDRVSQQLGREAGQRFDSWLDEALGEAEVVVNPRYGSWDERFQQVVPPEGPSTTPPDIPFEDPAGGPPEG